MATTTTKKLSPEQREALLGILKRRFEKNTFRHPGLTWDDVQARLEEEGNAHKLWSLQEMEQTGGEPDVTGRDDKTGEFLFCDCAQESPKGRRSLCYDDEALEARKEHKPKGSAVGMASRLGIELLSEQQYRHLQKLFPFDMKSSSWVQTPAEIRRHGGAIFCDRRYDHVFMYHNGAESYYAARGWRGLLKV